MSEATEYADRLERVAEAATPGPWGVCHGEHGEVEIRGGTLAWEVAYVEDWNDQCNSKHIAFNDPEAAKRHAAVIREAVAMMEAVMHLGANDDPDLAIKRLPALRDALEGLSSVIE